MSDKYDKMKVAELKVLASQYGIKKDDIVGHGVNGRVLGTDYIKALTKYDKKISVKHIPVKQSIKSQKRIEVTKPVQGTKNASPVKSQKEIPENVTVKTLVKTSPVKEKKEIVSEKTLIKTSPVKEKKEIVLESIKSTKNIIPPEDVSVKTLKTIKNVSPPKQINKKCAAPTMTNINEYKKCDVDKICNIATGNCVANTKLNNKDKIMLTVDDRKLVGDEATVTKLQKTLGGTIVGKSPVKQNEPKDIKKSTQKSPVKHIEIKDIKKVSQKSPVKHIETKDIKKVPQKISVKHIESKDIKKSPVKNITKDIIKKGPVKNEPKDMTMELRTAFIECITK